jgi:hypothetical protein
MRIWTEKTLLINLHEVIEKDRAGKQRTTCQRFSKLAFGKHGNAAIKLGQQHAQQQWQQKDPQAGPKLQRPRQKQRRKTGLGAGSDMAARKLTKDNPNTWYPTVLIRDQDTL